MSHAAVTIKCACHEALSVCKPSTGFAHVRILWHKQLLSLLQTVTPLIPCSTLFFTACFRSCLSLKITTGAEMQVPRGASAGCGGSVGVCWDCERLDVLNTIKHGAVSALSKDL